jgi:urease accessory protein
MAILFQQKVSKDDDRTFKEAEILSLTCSDRQRSRLAAMLPSGRAVAIVLPRGEVMNPGDRLISTCGQSLLIQAMPEPLMRISAQNPFELMRLTYHLANRHVKAMLTPQAIYIEPDTVLGQMALLLGASVTTVTQPFLPEAGAYSPGHRHHHGEVVALDDQMGQVGEALSMAAHRRTQDGPDD